MKKLVTLLFVLATVMVANAQVDSLYILDDYVLMDENYNFDEEYVDLTDWCADTLIIYDDDPYSIEIGAVHWYSYNEGQWLTSSSITITKENEGRWSYYNYHTGMWFDFYITLATTPEETKVSFEREVPLEPCGTEIFAYDLIEGEGVYSIYNTVGQLVKTVNVKGMQKVVLPSGLYFVRNDETTTKVVVE